MRSYLNTFGQLTFVLLCLAVNAPYLAAFTAMACVVLLNGVFWWCRAEGE